MTKIPMTKDGKPDLMRVELEVLRLVTFDEDNLIPYLQALLDWQREDIAAFVADGGGGWAGRDSRHQLAQAIREQGND